ncbi:Na/Pi cotransporter family protein [Thiomicrorhabdus sp.]|uniref:Na/Pi cotransporter family protein n=1 Tax=Thiomicrorhabdus sp. TaxID=2039724 RepID=UPI003568D691
MQELNTIMLTAGGLGLFLLGMIVMTESLKNLAGDRIRAALLRFTRTPTTGAITGAIGTAIVQSSSATTLAAVGFVGAGLMSFSNALGIIFGANVGTTITGWMVVLLGFKFSIGTIASAILLVGVLLRLFAHGKWKHIGLALAGFGLLFIGIDTMQAAMAGLVNLIDFSRIPSNNWIGLLQLVVMGMVFTTITQSSSAGVALTLTALFSGIVEFEQAVALVIGMDIGTTVKSLMAAIGGTVGAKRTGLSHVVYNLMTAVMALFLITPYTEAWAYFGENALYDNAEIALVGFHTLFNFLGVLLILPFSKPFARLIRRIIPQAVGSHTEQLDPQLLQTPELALNAVQQTLIDLTKALLRQLHALMQNPNDPSLPSHLQQLQQELDETQIYLDRIHLTQSQSHLWKRLVSMIHMLDHLQRLHERCEEESDRAQASKQFTILQKFSRRLENDIVNLQTQFQQNQWDNALKLSRQLYYFIRQDTEGYRHKMVQKMGQGEISADECRDSLEAIRWMERISKHLYRISYHLEKMLFGSATGKEKI